MLEEQLAMVERFHLDVTKMPMPEFPTKLVGDRRQKRGEFLKEELVEFGTAETTADQADALVDLIYVAMGGLLEMGIRPGPAFKLVHNANMMKVSGANKRGDQYEAAKPPGWYPPDWDRFFTSEITRAEQGEDRGHYAGLTRKNNPWANTSVKLPKILLLGYGRHGKDTVAEILRDDYGFRFTSSSMFCAERVMMPAFERAKVITGDASDPHYATVQECFDDRHNHRAFWFKEIEAYNYPDRARLAKDIYMDHDIYVGIRSAKEFHAAKNAGVFDHAIWVDALDRHPAEPRSSCTVEPWMADFTIDNNGTLEDLKFNVRQLMERLS